MATFTIKFEGLVVHVGGKNTKRHAVLVDDYPTHKPCIIIPKGDVVPPATDDLEIRLFDNDRITFHQDDFANGPAGIHESFDKLVPRLGDFVAKGTIRPTVEAGTPAPDDGAVAFLIYPAGTLSAPETLMHPVEFKHGTIFVKTQCVPTGVLFTATPLRSTVRMSITSQPDPIVLRDDATIEVTNVSGKGVHFKEYAKLMTEGSDVTDASEDKTRQCKATTNEQRDASMFIRKVERQREAAAAAGANPIGPAFGDPNPECSNSAWP